SSAACRATASRATTGSATAAGLTRGAPARPRVTAGAAQIFSQRLRGAAREPPTHAGHEEAEPARQAQRRHPQPPSRIGTHQSLPPVVSPAHPFEAPLRPRANLAIVTQNRVTIITGIAHARATLSAPQGRACQATTLLRFPALHSPSTARDALCWLACSAISCG